MFNSRVAIAIKSNGEEPQKSFKVITPRTKPDTPKKKPHDKTISVNSIGNPGLKLSEDHPANVIEKRRKYAAREYLDKINESGYNVSPLAVSALGLSKSEDGTWGTKGTPDERLYGQNLTKYLDTKLIPNGKSHIDHVTFGNLIRDPYFKVRTPDGEDNTTGRRRAPVGEDPVSGRIVNPLSDLTSHHFAAQESLLNTVDGIEKSAFPTEEGVSPKITNVTGAINRGLRSHFKRFNQSLYVNPEGDKKYFYGKFTTLGNNIQRMFKPYDRTQLQPPTQDQLYNAKKIVKQQRPDLFNDKGDYANSDIADNVNSTISRYVIDKNKKAQLQQHQEEYSGLTRALKNVAVCPCPHCQIPNYNNPLATVLDSSLHHDVKNSDDPILKNVFKKHFGFDNPHALMVNDPETVYTREDGSKGGGYPHPLSTNIIRQVLHGRLKLRN